MKKILVILVTLITINSAYAEHKAPAIADVNALLEGAAWVTSDLDASIDFYTRYLGYEQYKRVKFSSRAVLDTYGIKGDREIEYAALLPANWSKETAMPGLNFAEIADAEQSGLDQDAARTPIVGEVVLAFKVNNLEAIASTMREAGVPMVTDLTPSATGRSVTLTVIDPNGVRVQMYELIKK